VGEIFLPEANVNLHDMVLNEIRLHKERMASDAFNTRGKSRLYLPDCT
jgi:hypothetical protein